MIHLVLYPRPWNQAHLNSNPVLAIAFFFFFFLSCPGVAYLASQHLVLLIYKRESLEHP